MSSNSAPGTIHITPSEASRIQSRIKDRRAKCSQLAGSARQPTDKQALHQTITMLNLTNDMDIMGGGGFGGGEPEERSEAITVLAINPPYKPSTAELSGLEGIKLGIW